MGEESKQLTETQNNISIRLLFLMIIFSMKRMH